MILLYPSFTHTNIKIQTNTNQSIKNQRFPYKFLQYLRTLDRYSSLCVQFVSTKKNICRHQDHDIWKWGDINFTFCTVLKLACSSSGYKLSSLIHNDSFPKNSSKMFLLIVIILSANNSVTKLMSKCWTTFSTLKNLCVSNTSNSMELIDGSFDQPFVSMIVSIVDQISRKKIILTPYSKL